MTDIPQTFATAVELHQSGRLAEAGALYRQILALDPKHVTAMNNLAMLVPQDEAEALLTKAVALRPDYADGMINLANARQARGKLDEAVAWYERALAVRPNSADALINLGNTLRQLGKLEDAVAKYRRAVELAPEYSSARYALGWGLQGLKKYDEAIAQYERALALEPGSLPAIYNIGTCYDSSGRGAQALKWFRWALTIDPTLVGANVGMIKHLEAEGRLAEAAAFRKHVPRPIEFDIVTAPRPERTMLLPGCVGPGNVPLHTLLDNETTSRIQWSVDFATDEQEQALPPFDVVFNGIGNGDLIGPSFERLSRFHQRRPMLNPPASVLRTRRDLLPDLLGDIPDVVMPRVVRLRRDEMMNTDLAATLAARGLTCPVLMRPLATHGGEGMILIETPGQLAKVGVPESDACYFIAYYDGRAADGCFRKYRMIFVDRKPYPYHLAISDKWLVHYYSANMLAGQKREEEKRFFADPAAAMGRRAADAIDAIARRMDMDFAGIDFTVTPDGRVLVFEANANMSVYNTDDANYAYKKPYVTAIVDAFRSMIDRHCQKRA